MRYSYSNPAIKKLDNFASADYVERASYGGVALKSVYFVLLTFIAALASFILAADFFVNNGETAIMLLIVAPLAAFICSLIAIFKPSTTPVTGTLYAVFEGLAVGFISLIFETAYSGVVFSALASTLATLLVMTVLYSTGVIRVGAFFKRFMLSALLAALAFHFIMIIGSFIWRPLGDIIYGNSLLSIGISIIMVILASLMILLDLNRITNIVESGLDKRYEWYAAFGLLLTIVWLYLEFLRLFAKIASRKQ
jgi:uncharacterized YccA/Bax inhibitor family protein